MLPMLVIENSRATGVDQEWMWLSDTRCCFFRGAELFPLLQWCGVGWMPFCMLGAYLSPAFLVLGLLGVYNFPRRSLPWLVLIVAFFILGMGNYFGPYSPWVLLHNLPVFSWLRVVPRFFIMLSLCLAVLAGFGLELLARQKPIVIVLGLLLLGAGTLDGYLIGPPNLVNHSDPQQPLPRSQVFRQFRDTNDLQTVRVNSANMGISNCSAQMATRDRITASNQPGYKGEQYLLGAGSLALSRWTPETLDYDVDVESPTVMVINQNYDPPWKLYRGKGELFSHNGLIAVSLPAGKQHPGLFIAATSFWPVWS